MACSNIRDNTTIREKACNANGKRSLIDSPPFSCGPILTQFSHALSPFRSLWWSVRYSYLLSTTIVVIYALSFWPTQLHTCTTGQTNIHRGSCFGSWSCLDPSGTTAIYEYSCAGEMVSTCVIPTFFYSDQPTHILVNTTLCQMTQGMQQCCRQHHHFWRKLSGSLVVFQSKRSHCDQRVQLSGLQLLLQY
jgi:hypothetical protein